MQESGNGDSVNSSLTDLMTSLMVIFVLLLLVFLQRRATGDPAVAEELRKALVELKAQGLSERNIQRNGNVILIVVPDRLMNFESGKSELRPQGLDFLRERIPQLAGVLCSNCGLACPFGATCEDGRFRRVPSVGPRGTRVPSV